MLFDTSAELGVSSIKFSLIYAYASCTAGRGCIGNELGVIIGKFGIFRDDYCIDDGKNVLSNDDCFLLDGSGEAFERIFCLPVTEIITVLGAI